MGEGIEGEIPPRQCRSELLGLLEGEPEACPGDGVHAAIHALRMRVERTFAWEDKCKRLLLRFERIQQRHYGMKLMAYTLINLRGFCGV